MRRATAFTLVELLVSMAILGILMTLLSSALREVRDMGRSAACLNNLRQIGLAVHAYANDYEDYLVAWAEPAGSVPAMNPGEGTCGAWIWRLRVLGYVKDGGTSDIGDSSMGALIAEGVFLCPSYSAMTPNSSNLSEWGRGKNVALYRSSYGLNTCISYPPPGYNNYKWLRLGELRNPSQTYLVADAVACGTGDWVGMDQLNYTTISPRHSSRGRFAPDDSKGKAHMGFADGHVAPISTWMGCGSGPGTADWGLGNTRDETWDSTVEWRGF